MWRNSLLILTLVTIGFSAHAAKSDDESFQYFSNQDIDFWSKNKEPEKQATLPTTSATHAQSGFPWKKYLDPKNEEFFKEGDYTPPAPFMEIARNPSDDNIANWYHYLETKNALTQRLQERLVAYASQHPTRGSGVETVPISVLAAPRLAHLDSDATRFRLRLYFDSTCPHCQQMLGTMTELAHMGYWIELRQIDANTSVRAHIPLPVSDASRKELSQYQIQAVPLLLVGDLKKRTFFKIQGYQSTDAVLQALRSESTQKPGGHS